MPKLVKRTYRIRKNQDPKIKKLSKKLKISESQIARDAFDIILRKSKSN